MRGLFAALPAVLACNGTIGEVSLDEGTGPAARGASSMSQGSPSANGSSNNGTSAGDSPLSSQTKFACDKNARPPAAALRRMTSSQYRNTLSAIATSALGDAAAGSAIMTELANALHGVPDDQREPIPQDLHGSYRRLDQSLQQEHVDAYYAVGVAMSKALTTPERLAKVAGACAADQDAANDADCLDRFIQRFGTNVLRRPPTDEDIAFYRSVYGAGAADPAAYADVISVMLNAPQFLYFVEHGAADAVPGQQNVYEVSPYELATRLSYQFWDTMPDDELLASAKDGTLLDPVVYDREVARVYSDPRAQPTLSRFVADWLKTEDLPPLDTHDQDPTFKSFAGEDLPKPELRQQMIDDVLGTIDYFVWSKPGSLDDVLTTELSFNRGPDLAKIYGTPVWDGASTPPAFPAGTRSGLLTRALFLTSGSANTRPILKGVFIRRRMLCDDIPPPPPGANAVPPELRPDMTTREVVEELTQKAGTICASCHKTMINPLGFATEGFDALGRARTVQRLFDANGTEVGQKPVDTHSVLAVTADDTSMSGGPADLARSIVTSGKASACLARNYFRFTFARWEDEASDGCALEDMRTKLAEGGNLSELFKQIAMSPAFRRRTFQ